LVAAPSRQAASQAARLARRPAMPPKGKTALEALEDGVKRGATKHVSRVVTPEDEVRETLRSHPLLKQYTGMQIDGRLSPEGLTLRQTLLRDKRAKKDIGMTMGSNYYKALDKMYGENDEWAMPCLDEVAKKLPVNPRLLAAALAFKKPRKPRARMVAFCSTIQAVNLRELQSICNFLGAVNPRTSAGSLSDCLQVLRDLRRLEIQKGASAALLRHIAWKVDEVLCCALSKAKNNIRKPSVFCRLHHEPLSLILYEAAMERVLAHEGGWKDMVTELKLLTESMTIGQRLFGGAAMQVWSARIHEVLAAGVDALCAKASLTEDDILVEKKQRCDVIAGLWWAEKLPEIRSVWLAYRGVGFRVKVRSVEQEFDFLFSCRAKGMLAAAGRLTRLFCEDQLCEKTFKGHEGELPEFPQRLVCLWEEARAGIMSNFDAMDPPAATVIVDFMTKRATAILATDRALPADIAFWVAVAGEVGHERLVSAALGAFPATGTDAEELTASVVAAELLALQQTPLFFFVQEEGQNVVRAISEWVSKIASDRAPGMKPEDKKVPELQRAEALLQNFIKPVEVEGKKLMGAEALKYSVQEIIKTPVSEEQLDILSEPTVFSFLLTPAEKKAIQERYDEIMKRVEGKCKTQLTANKPLSSLKRKPPSSKASSSKDGAKSSKTEASAEAAEYAAAMAMCC